MEAQHEPVTYIFKEINIGKYTSVKHYELISYNGTQNNLSLLLHISKSTNRLIPIKLL